MEAARLIVHAVTEPRGRSLEANLERLASAAAAQTAASGGDGHGGGAFDRAAARPAGWRACRRSSGYDVQLNVMIDPEVVGGLRVSLGDELIDGTLASRLGDAQRRIAG